MHILILVICHILMLIGLIGCILPMLPGTPLIFIGIYIYAWLGGFTLISKNLILILLAMTTISVLIEYTSSSIGARRLGASKLGFLGALIGTIVGVFFIPWGIILGPLLGALIGELLSGKNLKNATKAGTGAFIGFLGGTLLKLAISFAMIAVFTARLLRQ